MTEASHKLFPGMKFDDSSAKCRRRRRRRRRYGERRKVGNDWGPGREKKGTEGITESK